MTKMKQNLLRDKKHRQHRERTRRFRARHQGLVFRRQSNGSWKWVPKKILVEQPDGSKKFVGSTNDDFVI
jgi:hypothetical protein